MSDIQVKIGEFYLFRNPETSRLTIGKATSLKDDVVFFSSYVTPEELPRMERKPHHSKFELIRTDDATKEFTANIVKQVHVLRQQDFRSRFPKGSRTEPSELVANSATSEGLSEPFKSSDYFFFRQRFMRSNPTSEEDTSGQLLPELKPICVCQKIMNLDEETLECPSCKAAFHPDCMRQQLDIKCVQCKQDLPRKLVYTHKRAPLEDPNPAKRPNIDLASFAPNQSTEVKPQAPVVQPKLPYPSLKEDSALSESLVSFINSLKKPAGTDSEQLVSAAEQSRTMQTRKRTKDHFTQALLLGIAEAKLKGEAAGRFDATQPLSAAFWEKGVKFCDEISTQIESGMWVCFQSEVNKDYSKKFRQLQASLRHEDNCELRMQLLQGKIEPLSVTQLSASQLAPKGRQEQMDREQKKYFEQKIKVDDEDESASGARVMKTDQGLEFVSASKKMNNSEAAEERKGDRSESETSKVTPSAEVTNVAAPMKVPTQTFGMPKEVYEMYTDLEDKWSIENLTKRFKERITDHLQTNTMTKENMLRQIDVISAEYTTTAKGQ